jgi:hypothetical protein
MIGKKHYGGMMSEINLPDYKHFSRLNTIFANEAQFILASIELHEKNISDPDEYNKLFNEEMRRAYKVLSSAFDSGDKLKFTCEEFPDPYIFDESNEAFYYLDVMKLNLAEFCTWASKLKYNLPEELAKLSTCSCSNDAVNSQIVEDDKGTPSTKVEGNAKKGGKPKGALAEAIEHAYLKYRDEGNTEILRESKVREFFERLKELADEKGNPNFSKFIADRIENVKILPAGCSVMTKDKYLSTSNSREIKDKGRKYQQQRVSQILVELRDKYPLPT